VILTAVAVSEEAAPAVADEPVAPEEAVAPEESVEALDESVEALDELAEPTQARAEPAQPAEPPRRRRFAWLFARRRAPDFGPEPSELPDAAVAEPPLEPEANRPEATPPEPPPEPELSEPEPATAVSATEAALTAALDSLGQAHHRPYSRA
jgi:hypothetical protein